MKLYIGQDWHGNVHITDDKDSLPPDLTDFHEIWLPNLARHTNDATLSLEVEDFSEIVSLNRKGIVK